MTSLSGSTETHAWAMPNTPEVTSERGPMEAYRLFTSDPTNIATFIAEVARVANGKGEVSENQAASVLWGEFAFPQSLAFDDAAALEARQALDWVAAHSSEFEKISRGYAIKQTADEPPDTRAESSTLSPLRQFMADEKAIKRYVAELASLADEKGFISTIVCRDLLISGYGFPQATYSGNRTDYQAPYTALNNLAKKGLFVQKPFQGIHLVAVSAEGTESVIQSGVTKKPRGKKESATQPTPEQAVAFVRTIIEQAQGYRARRDRLVILDSSKRDNISRIRSIEEENKAIDLEIKSIVKELQDRKVEEVESVYDSLVESMSDSRLAMPEASRMVPVAKRKAATLPKKTRKRRKKTN